MYVWCTQETDDLYAKGKLQALVEELRFRDCILHVWEV
jgi:hypothetical protein